ncbi:MAG: hypothetical protein ACR2GB_02750 [Nocardioidaceae bacterium]
MLLNEGGPLLPGDLDPLQLREEIWTQVHDTVPPAQRDELARRLRPTLEVATERTLTTMRTGQYHRFIDLDALRRHGPGYRYGSAVSADRTAAEITASQTPDPDVLSTLANNHPDPEVRALALANPNCPEPVLNRQARHDMSRAVRCAALHHPAAGSEVLEGLALNILTNGQLDINMTLKLLLHAGCPADFSSALIDRIHAARPEFRLQAAYEATHAPPTRRDYLHLELLARATRNPYGVKLVSAVLGREGVDDEERLRWLMTHAQARTRRLIMEYALPRVPAYRAGS